MTATTESRPWDFSHVLDLVNSLSFQDSSANRTENGHKENHSTSGLPASQAIDEFERKDFASHASSLGDFSKIFNYLGTPANSPGQALAVQWPQCARPDQDLFTTKADYTSDGAAHFNVVKQHTSNDYSQQRSDYDELDTEPVSDSSVLPESPTLTKSQRKKQNRRARKEKDAARAAEKESKKKQAATVSESEADFVFQKTPAKKASIHAGDTTPRKVYNLRARDPSGKALTTNTADNLLDAARIAADRLDSAKRANRDAVASLPNGQLPTQLPANEHAISTKEAQQSHAVPTSVTNVGSAAIHSRLTAATTGENTPGTPRFQLVPASVGPNTRAQSKLASSSSHTSLGQTSVPAKATQLIQPLVVRSGEDRHWALLMKLIGAFYEDRKHLISPMNLTTHNNDPNGIHVFVDASNIFIGFKDQLKRSRNIPAGMHIPTVHLSFDALALLIERRRPVAKRILAGSTPWLPAFDTAKAVGYECSILEKVYKARELTERQIYFKEHEKYGNVRRHAKPPPANSVATANGASGGGSGSGSETNTPQYAPAALIEQGVDEVLHLKILESVVDADKPGTIVLATGDAAQAEYSQGFMAMAERALKKGWTVELVSWSKNISAMYTRRAWREAWGDRFKIVTLDDYAEELLDM